MDKSVVLSKLDSLSRCISRVEQKRPVRKADLAQDIDSQDIIMVNLQRAVQLCVDIGAIILSELDRPAPATMSEIFEELYDSGVIGHELTVDMRRSVGFRNIAVHAYRRIDWDIVWVIISEHLDQFRRYAEAVTTFVSRRQ